MPTIAHHDDTRNSDASSQRCGLLHDEVSFQSTRGAWSGTAAFLIFDFRFSIFDFLIFDFRFSIFDFRFSIFDLRGAWTGTAAFHRRYAPHRYRRKCTGSGGEHSRPTCTAKNTPIHLLCESYNVVLCVRARRISGHRRQLR